MAFRSKTHKAEMQEGLDDGNSITPSVIALARISGVSTKAFAKALVDEGENTTFRNDVAQALQRIYVAKAVAEAAANAVDSLKKVLGLKKA